MIVLSATVFAAMMFLKRLLLVRAVSGLTFAYFLLSLFSKNIPVLYAYADVDSVFAYGLSNWIASFIGLFMVFTLFFVMLLFSGRGNGAFLAFIFAGSLMELVVLGFTTTVVPSMQRCCFLSYTMIEIPVLYYLRMIFRVLRIRERSGRLKEAHKTKKST